MPQIVLLSAKFVQVCLERLETGVHALVQTSHLEALLSLGGHLPVGALVSKVVLLHLRVKLLTIRNARLVLYLHI